MHLSLLGMQLRPLPGAGRRGQITMSGMLGSRTSTYRRIVIAMDIKRDQLETRVKTLENMLLAKQTPKKPNQNEIASLEKQLNEAKKTLEEYDKTKKA
jgi:hypothetical protein